MISSQFSFRQRLSVKRVASIFAISLAVSLAGCSYQGISYEDVSGKRYSKAGSIPIPPEPVYGYPDDTVTGSRPSNAPYWKASTTPVYEPAAIKRTALAPVDPSSDRVAATGDYVGGTYALQPVDAHDARNSSKPYAPAKTESHGKRYAQAGPGYYDRDSYAYKPSYRDFKPYKPVRRRHDYSSGYSDESNGYRRNDVPL